MNALSSRTLALAALPLTLLLSAGAAQAQTQDLAMPATSCTPNTGESLSKVSMNPAAGFIRANNLKAGTVVYTCNLLDSFIDTVPIWTRFGMQYRDPIGGRIVTTLYGKNKVTGVSFVVAAVASPASAVINNVAVPLPVLDYNLNSYYAVIRMVSDNVAPPEAHMIRVEQ
jgi:hypothetical protein